SISQNINLHIHGTYHSSKHISAYALNLLSSSRRACLIASFSSSFNRCSSSFLCCLSSYRNINITPTTMITRRTRGRREADLQFAPPLSSGILLFSLSSATSPDLPTVGFVFLLQVVLECTSYPVLASASLPFLFVDVNQFYSFESLLIRVFSFLLSLQ